ncbi:MAG: 50S ribosomal protein L30 [Candidatus Micrarchaeota archaeon]
MTSSFVAVRIRGSMETRTQVERTLTDMRLGRRNHCAFYKNTASSKGMLQKAKDFITYGDADAATAEKLIRARGQTMGGKPVTDEFVAANSAYKTIGELAKAIAEGNATLSSVKGMKPVLRLNPPRKGYGGTIKQPFPKGALGNRKDKIGELLLRMA